MRWWKKKRTHKFIAGLFFSVLIFQGAVVSTPSVHAQATQSQVRAVDNAIEANTNAAAAASSNPAPDRRENGEGPFGWMLDAITSFFIWVLLQIRNFIFLIIASPAASAFAWSIDPANVSGPTGIFNLPAIYTLWQFIRDFFNLFFILILLFSAFATIFQVDSFNIRNIFKNVILVALLINFSFPITRFLIDATNVPMYYFINDVIGNGAGRGGQTAMNNLLGYSGISSGTMANIGEGSSIVAVLTSIVFAFLFGISLAVLAVMMIIRLIALTLLLIFSPLGFAGALLPGLNKYGQEWWSKFWSYALFGPAAALMLVVSLKFLEASGGLYTSMKTVAGNNTVDPLGATTMASVIFFTFPIILIWTTIGMANKFAIAGSATVVGMGYGASNWTRKQMQKGVVFAGRKVVNNPVTRGVGSGIAQRFNDNKIVKYVKSPSKMEAKIRGAVGTGTAQGELRKLHESQVKKELDELKKNKTSHSEAVEGMKTGSKASQQANAMYLAQNGDVRNAEEFRAGLDAVKDSEEFASEFIKKSQGAIDNIGDLTKAVDILGKTGDSATTSALIDKVNPSALPTNGADYQRLMASPAFVAAQSKLPGELARKMKKEGELKVVLDQEIFKNQSAGRNEQTAKEEAYASVIKNLASDDLAKQSSLIQGTATDSVLKQYFKDMANTQPAVFQKLLASKELKNPDMQVLLRIQEEGGAQARRNASAGASGRNASRSIPNPNLDTSEMTYDGQPPTPPSNQSQGGPQA